MTTKTKARSRMLEAVHETASNLHRLGFIDKRRMHKYDALCRAQAPDCDPQKVGAVQKRL